MLAALGLIKLVKDTDKDTSLLKSCAEALHARLILSWRDCRGHLLTGYLSGSASVGPGHHQCRSSLNVARLSRTG